MRRARYRPYTGRVRVATRHGASLDTRSPDMHTPIELRPAHRDESAQRPAAAEEPPPLDLERTALFLDLDGTLAEICDAPSQVIVPARTIALLGHLERALDGAIAILSGRPGEDIDQLLDPLLLPYAANHGAEYRDRTGVVHRAEPPAALTVALHALRRRTAAWPGVLIEPKALGVAVHYRRAPSRAREVEAAVRETAAAHAGVFDVQPGKMVYELKPRGVDKGRALRTFMQAAPYVGRVPVMVGDDLTDEAAFGAAQQAGGFGIKVGAGPSTAWRRVAGPRELARWLEGVCRPRPAHGINSKEQP